MHRRFTRTRPSGQLGALPGGALPAAQVARTAEFHFDQAGSRYTLVGEVDAFTVAELHRALRQLVGSGSGPGSGSGSVRIGIERTSFLNHRALLELAVFGRDLAGRGGRLVIEGARPAHRRLWTLLGLDGDPSIDLA